MKTILSLLLLLLAASAPAQLFNYPAPGPTTTQFNTLSNLALINLNGSGTNTTLRSSGTTNSALRVVGGLQTNSNPVTISGTWSNSAVAFDALRLDVTNASSAASSAVIEWLDSGTTRGHMTLGGAMTLGGSPPGHGTASLALTDSSSVTKVFLLQNGGGQVAVSSNGLIYWASTANAYSGAPDAGFARSAAGEVEVNSGAVNAYRDLRLRTAKLYAQPSNPSSSATFGQVFAKTNAATTEVYVMDGAGNVTQISPHARASSPAPASVDAGDKTPIVIHHANVFTGEQEWLHLSAMARKLEQLTGEKFVWKSRLPQSEVRDWDAEQARLEADSNSEVQVDRAKLREWERSELPNKGPRPEVREKHRRAPKPDFLK